MIWFYFRFYFLFLFDVFEVPMKSLFSARSHMFHFPARVIAIGFLGIAAPDAAFGADPAACTRQ